MMTLARLEKVLETACENGVYFEGYLFEFEPAISRKLLQDRKVLLAACEKVLARLHPTSAAALMLKNAIREAEAGWPKDD